MLGRNKRNKGKGVPKELPPVRKKDPFIAKFQEVLAGMRETNRLLAELVSELRFREELEEKKKLIARLKEVLKGGRKEMTQLLDELALVLEPKPPAASKTTPAPKAAAPAAGAIQPTGLGQKLIEQGIITQSQLAEAEAAQKERGGYLGQILVEMGFVKQDVIIQFLIKQCKIPYLSLLDYEISKDLLELIPKEIRRRYNLLPVDTLGRILTIAMVDPLDTEALEAVRKLHPNLRVKPVLCDWQHFKNVSARLFGDELV